MNENIKIQKQGQIKCYLQKKEEMLVNSQIQQNKIENQIKQLENKRNSIIKNKRSIIYKIISLIIYDIIILSIMILFISIVSKIIILNKLLISTIYVGVLSISITGAYISSKVEPIIKRQYNNKRLNNITMKLEEKENEKHFEIEKQKQIKNEITQIINYLDITLAEEYIPSSNNIYESDIIKYKTKCKIKKYDKD